MTLLLRSIAVFAAALCTFTTSADELMQIFCEDCRGTEHAVDFGNFAFNQTYGNGSWILTDELIIVNPQSNWVHVDLTFEMDGNLLSEFADFFGFNLGVPTGRIIVETTTDTTQQLQYIIDLDMVDTTGPLPVGDITNSPPPGNDDNCDDDSDGDNGSGGVHVSGGNTGSGGGDGSGGDGSGGSNIGGGGGGSGGGSSGGGVACTSAGDGDWYCVSY